MKYDAVIVAGGGVRAGGELPPWAAARLDLGMARSGGAPIVCLSAGTVHKPNPLDGRGRIIYESVAGARYLLARGVPANRLFLETSSWDTIGNAFFARTIHTDPRGWARLLVITSEFHMPRTEAIFRWIYGLPGAVEYSLEFEASEDAGIAADAIAPRRERERESLKTVERLAARLRSMADVHQWLFTEHQAYRASLDDIERAPAAVAEWY